ncbi:FAD-dependent monooxygenase [Saccharospirillum sp. HFRX-1]|uniref:FAD-dependent monooxygenase n=1 Tax=unclassified Saccharospirillum TaxID=2633430 RepID=UPI00371A29ED
MSTVKQLAIIGAGVAGLALAIFARKAGIKVTLFERSSNYSSIGAGVTLWPNASFVIKQLGLMDQLIQAGGQPSFTCQFDRQNNQQAEFSIATLDSICGFPTVCILREDLIRLLAEKTETLGATIHFNKTINTQDITQLQQDFDLVVGCDGRMRSAARECLYKEPVPAQYQGFINIIGISKIDLAPLRKTIHDYRHNTERFGIVPVAKQYCYWAAAWPCELDRSRSQHDWFDEMQQRFQHWPDKVQQVLNSYQPDSLKRIFVHDLDPLPYWHKENLLIIGDAAHAPLPTSGQGASQALEDAWHLSQLLSTDKQLDIILKQLYETRIHKTTSAQQIGRQVAKQLFSQESSSKILPANRTASSISAQQLSDLYMQGLRVS